jgi:hypothetical protein
MKGTIAKKDTLFGHKFQFPFVVWACMRPTRTPKHLKKGIISLFIEKKFNRSLHIENTSGSTLDEKTGSRGGITPKTKRNRCTGQKSEFSLNNMAMLTFKRTILLMCVWTC